MDPLDQAPRWAVSVGAFLRTRRAGVRPEQVGFPLDPGRRVPGLRREEVAVLAGVSVDYYVRLEQGRGQRPSPAVLDALARALLLDEAAHEHLRHVAGVTATAPRESGRGDDRAVRPGLHRLLDAMPTCPAFVLGRRTELLACNPLGAALHGDPMQHPPGERAMARLLFLDPATRALYPRWEQVARDTVGALRRDAGRHPDDPALHRLIAELTARDSDFRRWWNDHHVYAKRPGSKQFRHPLVGDLTLTYETLSVADDPDQILVVYSAEPGSPDAERLTLLATWSSAGHGRGRGPEYDGRTGSDHLDAASGEPAGHSRPAP